MIRWLAKNVHSHTQYSRWDISLTCGFCLPESASFFKERGAEMKVQTRHCSLILCLASCLYAFGDLQCKMRSGVPVCVCYLNDGSGYVDLSSRPGPGRKAAFVWIFAQEVNWCLKDYAYDKNAGRRLYWSTQNHLNLNSHQLLRCIHTSPALTFLAIWQSVCPIFLTRSPANLTQTTAAIPDLRTSQLTMALNVETSWSPYQTFPPDIYYRSNCIYCVVSIVCCVYHACRE